LPAVWFLLGLGIGALIGVFFMAIVQIAAHADRRFEDTNEDNQGPHDYPPRL
jgi:hypothetical protein